MDKSVKLCTMALKPSAILDPELNEAINSFINDLLEEKIVGACDVAMKTLVVLRKVVAQCRWRNPNELIALIRQQGRRLKDAQPSDYGITNITGRVLKIIRDECKTLMSKDQKPVQGSQEFSLQKLILPEENTNDYLKQEVPNLKGAVIEIINELITELETGVENISSQALEHIHANEIILTAGKSRTVEAFLKKAAKKRKFQVIVVEGAPLFHGHSLAKSLAGSGIETSVISDAAVFATMSRVNKVLIGTHTVLADGGLKAVCGMQIVAQCAKFFSVPVVVCTSMFKFSQKYYCQDDFDKSLCPQNILSYSEGHKAPGIQEYSPVFDYVPPDLVTLYVTNIGGQAPAYVYRLIQEIFSVEDNEFL